MRRSRVGQVVEPVAGAEVGRAARRLRPPDARRRSARPARGSRSRSSSVSPGDGRVVRVQLAVPVDLVEAHVREAEERPARAAADRGRRSGRPSPAGARARRAPARRTSAPRRPSGRSTCPSPRRACRGSRPSPGCGTGGRARGLVELAPGRRLAQAPRQDPRPVVVSRGPVVTGQRGDRVRRQQQRVVVDATRPSCSRSRRAASRGSTARRSRAEASRRSPSSPPGRTAAAAAPAA